MNKYKTKVYSKLKPNLLTNWQELWEKSAYSHFFNSPAWARACLETYQDQDLLIFTVYFGSKLQAVLPVVHARKFGVPTLRCPGGNLLDKSSLLLANTNQDLLRQLLKALAKYNFYLAEVEVNLADLMAKIFPEILSVPTSTSPFLPLLPDPLRYCSAKYKKRKLSLIKKCSPYIWHAFKSPPSPSDFRAIIELEKASSKRQRGIGLFHNPTTRQLINRIIKISPESMGINILYYHKQPIAADMGFIYRQTFGYFYTVYDNRLRHLEPGNLTRYFLIQELAKRNFSLLDLYRGHSANKETHTPHFTYQSNLCYSPHNLVFLWWKFVYCFKPWLDTHESLYKSIRLFKYKSAKLLARGIQPMWLFSSKKRGGS